MIHPSAIVSPKARVADSACIGPWCLVDDFAEIGENVVLESRVHVLPYATIGEGTQVFDGASIGNIPQDLKFAGEVTQLKVGKRCTIREYCTLHRGTSATGETIVGDDVLLMAYVHVAHDCRIGNGAVLSNAVQLGGHVEIGEYATIGGTVAVAQCCHIGAYAFVGGTLKVDRDVPPASKALGNPLIWAGLNLHALRKYPERFPKDRIVALDRVFRELYRSRRSVVEVAEELKKNPDKIISEFFANWTQKIIRP